MTASPRRFAALLALVATASACADAPRDPVALLVAPEAKAALEVGSSLPTLGELARRNSPEGAATGDLARAETLWREAAALPAGPQAEELRGQAYALAAAPLAAAMDSTALAGTQARLERWIELAGNVLRRAEFPDLAAALSDASSYLTSARALAARGQREAAVALTLRASDRLAETTPQAVAARLTAEDEVALASLRQLASQPSAAEDARRSFERADRLVRGAREALTAGRYEVAIRRAYYARQLLATEQAHPGATAQ